MVEMASEAPIDALPCGFYGYTQREYLDYNVYPSPYPKFKTKYYFPGEVISNPPFGTNAGGQCAAARQFGCSPWCPASDHNLINL
jgi:hypothetical protein